MAQGRRVVITGLGTVSPNGNDVSSTWESIVNGQSGVELIEKFDTSEFTTKFGASVKDFDKNENIDPKDCLLYTSPSPRDSMTSRMPSSA